MISGVVAQEPMPLPKGVLASVRAHADNDNIFNAVLTRGDDQRLIPGVVADDADEFYPGDVPEVLTPDYFEAWVDGEMVFTPFVARGLQMFTYIFADGDFFYLPDIRIPGVLQAPFHADDDMIFATPLILDPGMLRAELVQTDDSFFRATLDAARTLFPQRHNDADVFYATATRAGALGPPFLLSDDTFFAFSSLNVFRPQLVFDDALPVTFMPATTWDGVNIGVTISSNGLNAALLAPAKYCGARSTQIKSTGRYYFEVTVGPSHGITDSCGILLESATLTQMSQFATMVQAVVVCNQRAFGIDSKYIGGLLIANNAFYAQFGRSEADPFPHDGDVFGFAFDMSARKMWVRLNGGHWNNDQWGLTVMPNQDPLTGVGGVPLPDVGRFHPAVSLGGQAGGSNDGFAGDSFTGNFGATAYRNPRPAGYSDWAAASPFGVAINGDSFGTPLIGIPASLDNGAVAVIMSNGNLTATHNTTDVNSGAMSASSQNTGRYYFEVAINATHGQSDSVGILISSPFGSGGPPEGSLSTLSGGTACAAVYAVNGAIWSNSGNSGKSLGALLAGDVVGVAVDLSVQSPTSGGRIWFRKKSGGVTSNWNGDPTGVADPTAGTGGLGLQGFSYQKTWVPCVGFSGTGTAVGDKMTANFGATPYAMVKPNGLTIWPAAKDLSMLVTQAAAILGDDTFPVPFIDLADRTLLHVDYVHDEVNDLIFAARSFGGNLLLLPAGPVIDADNVYGPAYFATFDPGTKSANVTLSNGNLTATQSTQVAYTGARSLAQKNSGKYYFEITIAGPSAMSSQDGLGILTENGIYKNVGFDGINCVSVIGNSGIIFANNLNAGRLIGTPVAGDVVGCAINFDTRKAWFRRNAGGPWNGQATDNPETGVGGVNIQPLVSMAPAVSFGGSSPVNGAFTANFGATPFALIGPVGFGQWSGGSLSQPPLLPGLVTDNEALYVPRITPTNIYPGLVPGDDVVPLLSATGGFPTVGPRGSVDDTTVELIHAPSVSVLVTSFDAGTVSNVTLSNANLTATHANTTTDSGVRSSANKTGGKFYFEVKMNVIHGAWDSVAVIAPTSIGYFDICSGSGGGGAMLSGNGTVYNGLNSGKTVGALTSGDLVSVAVDITARKVWFRKNGGLWNGEAITLQNPTTGLGGLAFSSTTGVAPAVSFGGPSTAANDNQTANFGLLPFAYPVPTNFQPWPT